MHNIEVIFLVTILASNTARGRQVSKYSLLEEHGYSCSPYDTCSKDRQDDDLENNRCQCESKCIRANSCCIDSRYIHYMSSESRQSKVKATCTRVPSNYDLKVMMINKCDPEWRGSFTKRLCENQRSYSQSIRDPMPYVPVTSRRTQRTYKNYYCAACNNDVANSNYWDITVRLTSDYSGSAKSLDISTEDLRYDRKRRHHILILNGTKLSVDLVFRPPKELTAFVAHCVKDVVSDCAPEWKNATVRKQCHFFMGMVFISDGDKDVRYRNVFCAICNNVNFTNDTLCKTFDKPTQVDPTFPLKPYGSFELTLDVNWAYGEKVGSDDRCNYGNFYDYMFKKCRPSWKCVFPNFVRDKNGICGPRNDELIYLQDRRTHRPGSAWFS